jgi:hypothetical protein
MIRRPGPCQTEDGCCPPGSLGQNNRRSFCRTAAIRSSGKTPIAPLMTERCRVVSLSTRTWDGLLSPVFRQSEWVGSTATVRIEVEADGAEVIKATRKSSGESHCANIRQGRRLPADKSVNGNAAWTISPGWNTRQLFSESRIHAPRQNVLVAINLRLCFEKIKGAAGLGQAGNLDAAGIIRLQRQHRQTSARGQRNTGGQFQHAVGLDTDFDGLHGYTLGCHLSIAKPQPLPVKNPCFQ